MDTARYASNRCYTVGANALRTLVLSAVCVVVAASSAFARTPLSGKSAARDSLWVGSIHFRVNSSLVLADYMNNAATLASLRHLMSRPGTIETIDRIVVTASASPEGNLLSNTELAHRRAVELRGYMRWQWPGLQNVEFDLRPSGEDWNGLRRMVADDPRVPHRREMLDLLKNIGNYVEDDSALRGRLRSIGGGTAYDYLSGEIFPHLRRATAVIIDTKPRTPGEKYSEIPGRTSPSPDAERSALPHSEHGAVTFFVHPAPGERVRRPLFALKTNLLFDAFTALNAEIEVPFGSRWSVAGEWIFPWWLIKNEQYALEAGVGTVEGRYWFGGRADRPVLTGWFAGLYGGAGYYDIEWSDRGRQGELYHAGLSGGYAHTIGKTGNWRLEYALGLGYMHTGYREYLPVQGADGDWTLVRDHRGSLHWAGPTRAKVSLVWMIPRRFWTKGGAR